MKSCLRNHQNTLNLEIFGCLCYISNFHTNGDKFASRALKCAFNGYPFIKKGYKVVELATKKYYITRDIILKKEVYTFKDIISDTDTISLNDSKILFSFFQMKLTIILFMSIDGLDQVHVVLVHWAH